MVSLLKDFARYQSRATRFLSNPAALSKLLRRASTSARTGASDTGSPGPLTAIGQDLADCIALARAWQAGSYRAIAPQSIALVIAGLVYLLAPLDAVPDLIPAAGLLDDAAVIGFIAGELRQELDRFAVWRSTGATAGSDASA